MKPTPRKEYGFSAAGRANPTVSRTIAVTVHTRLSLDQTNSDEKWLEHESLGHFQAEDKILDSLIDWLPTQTNSEDEIEGLTFEPVKWVDGTEPEKDKEKTEWGESTLFFLITFNQDIDQDTL